MLTKEYRIALPMSVEEYRIAQLYMIQVTRFIIVVAMGTVGTHCPALYDTGNSGFIIAVTMVTIVTLCPAIHAAGNWLNCSSCYGYHGYHCPALHATGNQSYPSCYYGYELNSSK